MRKTIIILGLTAFMFACGNSEQSGQGETSDSTATETMETSNTGNFGEEITEEGAISTAEFIEQIQGKDSLEVKLSGKIDEVCQKKGCWMDIDAGDAGYITVRFKDYGFFVPKDAGGKNTIVEGVAYLDTISVEELKHYASDAGDSDSAIAAITEPEITYTITAKGVIVK